MVGEVLDKPSIEIGESNKGLDFLFISGDGPFRNSGNFNGIHLNGIVAYNDFEIFHFCPFKLALFRFQENIVFVKDFHRSFDHFPMFFQSLTKDQDIV